MTNIEIITRAKERLALPEYSPKKASFISWSPYYGLLALVDVFWIMTLRVTANGISDVMKVTSLQNFLLACSYGLQLLAVIWSGCFIGYAKNIYRKRNPNFSDIPSFLGRWGAVLGSSILSSFYQALWTILFLIPGLYAFSASITAYIPQNLLEMAAGTAVSENILYEEMQKVAELYIVSKGYIVPLIIMALGCIAGYAISYRYRLAVYFALEPGWRAGPAVRASKYLMQKQKLRLFKLDLRLLWYHIPVVLPASALMVTSMFVELSDPLYYSLEILSYLWVLAWTVFARSYIETIYAGFAEELMYPARTENEPQLQIDNQ